MPIRSAEEVKRILLDRVPSMVAYYDAAQQCRFANEAYAAFVGVPAAGVLGQTMEALLGPAEYANRRPHVREVLAGRRQSFERRAALAGRPSHLLITYVPDELQGSVAGFIVEIADVTPLRLAQQALSHTEARFRVLSESSPLGVYFADPTGKRTYVNSRWREIYGLAGADGLGEGWMRPLHEDDRDAVTQAWRNMASNGSELEMSFRIRHAGAGDVRVLRTRTRPVRDGEGAVTGFVGVLEDISDRRAAEERLRASEEFLDRTGRVARIGGWEVDLRTRQVTWSEHTRRICEVDTDYRPPFLGGERFYPQGAWAELSAAISAATAEGRGWDLELPFVTAKGRRLWVRVIGEAEMVGGAVVRLVGALQDVTEQRRQRLEFAREQALRQESERHAAELDRLLRERSEMLDVMAHEVRQPLNSASAALQSASAVLNEVRDQEAASRLLRAETVLGQVMASIDNTLAVASLLARPDPLRLADTDIDALLEVSVADMLPLDRPRIRIERTTDARTASMDMSLMRLALRNLLANALRYGTPGSEVVVSVGESDAPLGLRFDVTSRGGPIPDYIVGRLFERGSNRLPDDMSPFQGLGLGLYIVRRVMELHGGMAELAHNEAGRVTFALLLAFDD